MTLTELRYVVALARTQHFGRAAEACFVSQPTLSVALRKLEEELGVTLFERRSGEAALTPIGVQIVQQAERVLAETKVITDLARAGTDPLGSPFRFGTIYTVGPYVLPALMPGIRERAPKMALWLEEQFTGVLLERLRHGQLDAVLISEPFDTTGLMTRVLYDEPFVVALPAAHPGATQGAISANWLQQQTTLLLGAGNCFRDQVLKVCPRLAGEPASEMQRTVEGSSLETIRYMVGAGVGVTVLPCTAALGRDTEGLTVIRPFAGVSPERRIVLAWRAHFPRMAAIAALIEAIRSCPLPCVRWHP